MNVEDSEQMALYLSRLGLQESPTLKEADVILLNTCSVRRKPEEKAFTLLGQLKRLKAKRPNTIIGVCGCMAQLRHEEIRERCPHVDFVLGTAQISQIPDLVLQTLSERRFRARLELPPRKGAIVTDVPQRVTPQGPLSHRKIKAFVPIQYGCDKFCTFCIVPLTRGRERSRATQDILDEIKRLADQGVKEVTLLGQTVNSYGKNLLEGKVPFSQLLWKIADVDGIERIRFTSPYPRDFRQDLIETIRDCPKVMEHVHLPLQSGDDKVLREMRRTYTIQQFKDIYWKLRENVPGISITTDIIVGFPGETEDEFQNTLKVVSELRFDSAFMFAFSPRPGTPAAERPDQIPQAIKRRRLQELITLQNEITCDINQSEIGKTFEILVEGFSERKPETLPDNCVLLKGITRHNKTVHFPADPSRCNTLIGNLLIVQAMSAHLWGFMGVQTDDSPCAP